MPLLNRLCLYGWKKKGFEVRIWTEEDLEVKGWIQECEFARKCYDLKLYAFTCDYVRLKILDKFGGLYIDSDISMVKDPSPLFSGLNFSAAYESELVVCNAVIFSNNSTLIKEMIEFYENEIMSSDEYMGPSILTRFINSDRSGNKLKIYSKEYFYSFESSSHLIHWEKGSWVKSRHLWWLKSKNKSIFHKIYQYQKYLFKLKNWKLTRI